MDKETPYEYYDKKLGVKINFLISDQNAHQNSLKLFTYNAIKKRINSQTCTEKRLRRASLGCDALVLFGSLDRTTKDTITITFGNPQEEIKKSWFADHYIVDQKANDFYTEYRYGKDAHEKLDLKFIDLYTYQASVLNAVLLVKTKRKEYLKSLGCSSIDIWQSLSNDVNAFTEVPHGLPTTRDSLRYKTTQYQKQGYISIISGKHTVKNAQKVKTSEQMALLDELLAKHQNFDNAQVCDVFNAIAMRIPGWKTITRQTVANRKEQSKLVIMAGRKGFTELSNTLLMQNKRTKPGASMLFWTIDGWDAELMYQARKLNDKGHLITTYHHRPCIVVVLDPYNKYPVGYAIGTHETPELIRQALKNAIDHVKELFGDRYQPYQLQTDRYGRGSLTSFYQELTKNYTPAEKKNAKSKVIEPWFNYFNKKYCQYFDNWSGFNAVSGSENQPNSDMFDKIKKQFPDYDGVKKQLIASIETERVKKIDEYREGWEKTKSEYKQVMAHEKYLSVFGKKTGHTNKLQGNGLNVTINGMLMSYDSFELEFRKLSHINWEIQYDPCDLGKVLATANHGKYRFVLEQKYIQPMALADRKPGDGTELQRVQANKNETKDYIIQARAQNNAILDVFFESNPQLNDTLAKHLLTDSAGQHKNQRNAQKIELAMKAEKIALKQETTIKKQRQKSAQEQQMQYYNEKIDINQYL